MTPGLRRSLVFATDALEPLSELGRAAEQAGFDRVWTTEYPGRDAVARALAIGLATGRIGIGTGITYAFTRPPLAMAALAADVQRLCGGRFALGLGAGTRGVRRWYGAEFDPPAPRLAAYVGELAECWSRWPDELSATGAPDVFAAALHPVMARTAARACGGVLLHPLALLRTHLTERVLPAVRRGADDRNGPVAVAAWCVTSIDDDAERAREHARRQIAFYFSTPSYGPVTAGTEWEPVAAAVRSAFEDSGRAARFGDLAALVPDSLVDELAVAGDAAEARSQAQQRERVLAAAGIGEIVFQTIGADVSEEDVVANCHRIVESLGPGTTAATGDPHETVLGAR